MQWLASKPCERKIVSGPFSFCPFGPFWVLQGQDVLETCSWVAAKNRSIETWPAMNQATGKTPRCVVCIGQKLLERAYVPASLWPDLWFCQGLSLLHCGGEVFFWSGVFYVGDLEAGPLVWSAQSCASDWQARDQQNWGQYASPHLQSPGRLQLLCA